MLKVILLIGAGGFLGSVFRYIISVLFIKEVDLGFPLGTMVVNIVGCLFIGLLFGFFSKNLVAEGWRFFLITGFLGGFTTFSSFSLEMIILIRSTHYFEALLYFFGSLILGFLATGIGFWLVAGGK